MSARPAKTAMGQRPTIKKAMQGPNSGPMNGIRPKATPGGKKMPHYGSTGHRVTASTKGMVKY